MQISFAKNKPNFVPVAVNSKPLELVTSFNISGIHVSRDLKWNAHISELVKKAPSSMYFLRQLKRSLVALRGLTLFYITCVRSILEYASPVFHRALPSYLSEDLERLQKRAMRIIYPVLWYNDALELTGLPTSFNRREAANLFDEICANPAQPPQITP